jgi:hypothetical protein
VIRRIEDEARRLSRTAGGSHTGGGGSSNS